MAAEEALRCRDPLLGYSSLCSGNGVCIQVGNSSVMSYCQCNENYGGKGLFFDLTGQDCQVHQLAFFAIMCIALAVTVIALLAVTYRLATFGKLNFTAATPFEAGKLRQQRLLLMMLISLIMLFVHYSLVIFWNLYPHDSLASNLTFATAAGLFLFDAYWRGTSVLSLGIKTKMIKGYDDALQRMNTAVLILTLCSIAFFWITIIPHAFRDQEWKIHWHIAWNVMAIVVDAAWLITNIWGNVTLMKAVSKHARDLEASGASSANKAREVEETLKRLVPGVIVSPAIPAVMSLFCAIFLNASTYTTPIAILGYCAQVIVHVRELTPKTQAEQETYSTRASSTK